MAIHGSPSARRPKAPVTVTVALNSEVVVSDYLGAGVLATNITNTDASALDVLGIRVNCMTKNRRPHPDYPGRVEQTVQIWNTADGALFELGGGESTPAGLAIESFKVVTTDNVSVTVIIW
jgi:hypothetical protein